MKTPPQSIPGLALGLMLALAGCSTAPTASGDATGASSSTGPSAAAAAALATSSPECLARKIQPGPPLQPGAIPEAVLGQRQNGLVAIRYDLQDGRPVNVRVVSSTPPGLYDAPALEHAQRFRDPARNTVSGCVMTVDIRF